MRMRLYPPGSHFTAVWEFQVSGEKRHAFEKVYGPRGDWARLFAHDEGYIRTELIRDHKTLGRYVTLDFWASRLAYLRFKAQNRGAYKALDKRCEKLTQSERLIGEFEKAVPATFIWPDAPGNIRVNHTPIRPATPADIPAMIALERNARSAAHWSDVAYCDIFETGSPPRLAIVREDGSGSLEAFIIARMNGEECELENVVVANGARRRGIGSELMEVLRTEVQSQGSARIFLEVRESNTAARALYEKCGFQITGRRNSYYSNPAEDSVLYTLTNV
jgi:[ribosomal protein S18]-alanine N-acetyltransferase